MGQVLSVLQAYFFSCFGYDGRKIGGCGIRARERGEDACVTRSVRDSLPLGSHLIPSCAPGDEKDKCDMVV